MAQPVKVRVSYRDDAAYLLRLEEAVGKDDRQPEDWRKETCKTLRDLSVRLLQAVQGPVASTNGSTKASNKPSSSKAGASRS
jgi:hypothetical protein